VEAIGQLDEDDAHVLGDRQQQLAVVLHLPLFARAVGDVADLGDPVDDLRYLFPELALDVGDGHVGVLDHVVDEPAGDGQRVEVELGQDLRDLDAVGDVVLAGAALLPLVRALAEAVGTRQQLRVEPLGVRVVAEVPPRDYCVERRSRHSSPASSKLRYRPRPTIT
jgi:hypothetical protein